MIYPITPEFELPRPLLEGDQAIVDAIEEIEPGERGSETTGLIMRQPARRSIGVVGEILVGRSFNESGKDEFVFIDVMPKGIMAGIDTRERRSLVRGADYQVAIYNNTVIPHTKDAQTIKIEAARRIKAANSAASQ